MSIPRIYGASWRAIMEPAQMRNLQNYPIQWESYQVLRSTFAMGAVSPTDDIFDSYSTDEYRAIVPIYLTSVLTLFTNNYIISLTITDAVWWLLGALGVYAFLRNLSSPIVSLSAGVLTCYSPIGVSHIGSGTLHTASSLSISVFLCLIYRIIANNNSNFKAYLVLGLLFYLSSITYTYQWILIPFAILLIVFFDRSKIAYLTLSVISFFILRQLSYLIINSGNLRINVHQNDPIRAAMYFFDSAFSDYVWTGDFSLMIFRRIKVFIDLLQTSYHPFIILIALIGFILLNSVAQFRITIAGLIVTLGVTFFYGMPWVVMSSYPFIYFLVSSGVFDLTKRIFLPATDNRKFWAKRMYFVSYCIFINILGLMTNLDIFGNDSFAIMWWRGSYILH